MGAELILNRLDKVRSIGPGKWFARCPSHDDRGPSLSIRETADGKLLLHCFAGCPVDEVVSAAGLSLSDLFPEKLPAGKHSRRPKRPPINWRDLWGAIETDSIAISIAWSDFARGEPLSSEDAAFLSSRATHLADTIREVRISGR